jgi:recombination protein RecA
MRLDTQALMAEINKSFGEGTVLVASTIAVPRRFTSGSLALDVALGGGWPGGQWVEIIGKESAGKTAVALKTIAANQKLDPDFETLWIAAEAFDTDQATALGVDNTRIAVVPTQEMEFAFAVMLEAAESRAVDCIVLDSYPALIPGEEAEKAMDEFTTAVGARLMNKFARKAGKATKRDANGTERPLLGIIINQFRDKIGGFARYGTPQTSPGGHGKDYFFYARLEVSRDEYIVEKRPGIADPVKVGQSIKMRTIKNKAAAPQQTATVDFYFRGAPHLGFERGDYDLGKEYFTMGVLFGVVRKSGAWFTYADRKWHGKDAAIAELRSDKTLQSEIAAEVLDAARNPKLVDQIVEENIKMAEESGTRRGIGKLNGE